SLAPLTYTTSLPEAQCLWVTHEPLIPDHRANSRQAPSHEHATNAGAPRAVQRGIAISSDSLRVSRGRASRHEVVRACAGARALIVPRTRSTRPRTVRLRSRGATPEPLRGRNRRGWRPGSLPSRSGTAPPTERGRPRT